MADMVDISEIELHAYVDGALDAARQARISERIAHDPAFAERIAGFRRDKETLKRIYGPLSERPVPEEWLVRARSARPPGTVSLRLVGSIAAALAIGVLGTLTFQSLVTPKAGGIVEAALDARTARATAEESLDVAPRADARRYDKILSAAVKLPVRVPDMGRMGYRLEGIRLYRATAAAEILYRDGSNRLFTLYVRRSNGALRFDQFERNGLRVCVWQDDEVGAVMAGNVSTAAMQRLASLAYTGLTL